MTATDSDEPDDPQLREESDPPDGAGDPEDPTDDKLEVTGVQVAASTLASVSAAGVASLFGVHGTLIGAGVASVVATVGAAVYQRGLDRTSARLQEAPVAELVRPVVTRAGSRLRGGRFPDDPGYESWRESSRKSSRAVASSPPGAGRPSGWRSALAGRRWGVAAGVGAVLVATLVVLSMLEVAAQRPLSGDDRASTSIGAVVGSSGGSSSDDREPEDGTTTTSVPDEDPVEGEVDPSAPAPVDPDGSDGSDAPAPDGSGPSGSPSTTGEAPTTPSTTAGGSEPAPSPGSGSGSGSGAGEAPAGSG